MWHRARTTLTFGYFNRYRSLTTYRNALLIRFEYCHVELVYFNYQKTTQYPSVDKLIYLFLSSFTLKNQVNSKSSQKQPFISHWRRRSKTFPKAFSVTALGSPKLNWGISYYNSIYDRKYERLFSSVEQSNVCIFN